MRMIFMALTTAEIMYPPTGVEDTTFQGTLGSLGAFNKCPEPRNVVE
ncbi:4262_t:CDS:2 [Dentiscutata erythropus]|uniref:4262_t:CDS:1 n=1 Tax=Dentiscutata erythropus TaxID=1348616 RepID=A0A9N9AA98_9GLOM|nr:4262_t:CDS:2 [Dentiscutata erythropus]